MGWYPVQAHEPDDPKACRLSGPPQLTAYEAGEILKRMVEGKRQADGWYFLRCPKCAGSGRCSWLATLTRIPRWIGRGFVFIHQSRVLHAEVNPPEWTFWKRVRVAIWCSWGADLQALFR